MRITVSVKEERYGVPWDMYVIGDDDKPLRFDTVRQAVNFFADRNWTMRDMRKLDFNFEGVEEEK